MFFIPLSLANCLAFFAKCLPLIQSILGNFSLPFFPLPGPFSSNSGTSRPNWLFGKRKRLSLLRLFSSLSSTKEENVFIHPFHHTDWRRMGGDTCHCFIHKRIHRGLIIVNEKLMLRKDRLKFSFRWILDQETQ